MKHKIRPYVVRRKLKENLFFRSKNWLNTAFRNFQPFFVEVIVTRRISLNKLFVHRPNLGFFPLSSLMLSLSHSASAIVFRSGRQRACEFIQRCGNNAHSLSFFERVIL